MGTPPTIQFASLGMWDSFILMVMALVVFGPRRLPEIGRQIGKLMYEFRKASNDFKFQMEEELRSAEDAERRKKDEERMRALATTAAPLTIEGSSSPAASELPVVQVSTYSPAVATDPSVEETYPRIMPPSTGQQVPAARPGVASELNSPAPEPPTGSSIQDQPSSTAEIAPPATISSEDLAAQGSEQVAHHD